MKTVVFDVDDTLYNQIEPFKQAIKASFSTDILTKHKISMSQLYIRFRFFSDLAFPKTVDGSLSLEDMRRFRVKEAFNFFGCVITIEEAENFQKNYKLYQEKIELLDEMKQLLVELTNQNIQLAILTNGPTNHQKDKIKQLGIEQFIPETHRFISEKVGIAKPDPAVFKLIEDRLNISAEDLIYIGDSHENDVVGAKKAAWQCIWINKYEKKLSPEDIKPDREITSSREVSQVLNAMLND